MEIFKIVGLLLIVGFSKLVACGGGGWFNTFKKDNSYNFLDGRLIHLTEDNPLYNLSSSGAYGYSERKAYFEEKSHELNIEEWQNYFKNKLSHEELHELFYGEKDRLTQRYKKLKTKLNNPAFEKYLDFLEEQSKFAWSLESDRDPLNMIDDATALLKDENDKFLKLRYLFLAMRLNHYDNHYKEALALYKKYYPELKGQDSIVFEWIDALRAGALQHLGKDVASNQLYAKIFKNNKTNAYLGYYDFKVKNDTQWNNLLAQSKTVDDKALFHFLRAMKWDGVAYKEHRELAKIAPDSVWFERLSYMIMQELQAEFLDENSVDKNNKYEMANLKSYQERKAYFLETLAGLQKPKFFSFYAELYLLVKEQKELAKLPEKFKTIYALASKEQKIFIDMLSYINGVRAMTNTTKGSNEELFTKLAKLLKEAPAEKRGDIFAYTAYFMAKLYPKNSAKQHFSEYCSVLPRFGYDTVTSHMDSIEASDFEAYVEEKNRSYYEQKVFRTVMGTLAKNDVAKFLTLLYTKEGNFKKANFYLKQVPKLNRKTAFNPFNVSLSGNNRKKKGKGYEQRKFVETMRKIEQTLEKNPTSAMDHYLYATGLYNSSWFGNFPMVAFVERSVTGFSEIESERILSTFDKVEKEYNLAKKYAKSLEFKAKIAYQLLKLEYNRFIIENEAESYGVYVAYFEPKKLTNSATFTKAIDSYKNQYGDTKFGKEIIKKCATFRYFR